MFYSFFFGNNCVTLELFTQVLIALHNFKTQNFKLFSNLENRQLINGSKENFPKGIITGA